MTPRDSRNFIEMALINIDKAQTDQPDYAIVSSNVAIGLALVAIAKELKEMNGRENHIFAESGSVRNTDESELGW